MPETPSRLRPPRTVGSNDVLTPSKLRPDNSSSANALQPNDPNQLVDDNGRVGPSMSASRRTSLRKRRIESSSDEAIGLKLAVDSPDAPKHNRPEKTLSSTSSGRKTPSPTSKPMPKKLALQAEASNLSTTTTSKTSSLFSSSNSLTNGAKTTSALRGKAAAAAPVPKPPSSSSLFSGPSDANTKRIDLLAKKQSELELDIRKELQETKERLARVLDGAMADKADQRSSRKEDEERIRRLTSELEESQRHMAKLRTEQEADLSHTRRQLQGQIEELERERDSLRREQRKLETELQCTVEENTNLKMSIAKLNATIVDLEARIGALKAAREDREQLLLNTQQQVDNERQMQGPLRERIADLERRLHAAETHRRRLHNQVLELKGNIRVFCRVRPLLDDEKLMPEQSLSDSYQFSRPSDADPLHYYHSGSGNGGEEGETLTVLQDTESVTGQSRTKTSEFAFDRVFGPDSTQPDVFAEIADLVQSSLDGYRVCIFAYGQTGSGKTYTMEGPSLKDHIGDAKSDDGDGEEGEEGGMIPRAARQLFDTAHRLATERKWSFAFEASYLEIYNETIRDLLQPSDASNNGQKGADDLDIKHISGRTVVPGLTVVPVSSKEQLLDLLRMAARNRSVGGTLCNERSSRSHAVFTLSITSVNKVTQERLEGVLNLVDLAGSERLSSSQSTGERLKETQHINRSLSALGDVIAALQDSSYSANASKTGSNHANHHVPYRNSKLTFLLQPSLGGASSKTLMFVNVNPSPASVPESLCSLRFASKVRACHIGTAHKNLVPQGGGK